MKVFNDLNACTLGWSEKIKNDEIEKTAGMDTWQMVQNWLLKWFSWAAVKIELALQDKRIE